MEHSSIHLILTDATRVNTQVTVTGWIRSRRDSKAGISFLQVSDGSCFDPLQVIAANTLTNYHNEIAKLTTGCSVKVSGTVTASPAAGQAVELQADHIEVVGWVENPDSYPITPKPHTMEYLREVAHLRPRTNLIGALTRVRHAAAMAIHQFFDKQGFYWVHTPIITGSDCEGAGELFRVSTLDLMNLPKTPAGKIDFNQDFFGREAFLTVSGQLNLEAYCCAMSKVYTFGPTFRAENSNTSRHLAEFWMIEPEIAFANLQDDIELATDLLKTVFREILTVRADDMAFFAKRVDDKCIERIQHMVETPFEQIDYKDAIEILLSSKKKFEYPVKWGIDLQSEHERFLAEEHFKKPTVVCNYPKAIKSFYMRLNEDQETVACMDVLAPGIGEIIGGSQREERTDVLYARLQACGLPPEAYQWYLDLRRFGTVPHAGFGLGFERLLCYITGIANVRDVIPYPRVPGHAEY